MNNPIIEKAINIAGSQQKLADISKVSQSTIHKLLTGKSVDMRISTAIGLSAVLGLSVDEFLKQWSSMSASTDKDD